MIWGTALGVEIAGKDLRVAVLQTRFGKMSLEVTGAVPGLLDLAPEEQRGSVLRLIKELKVSTHRVFLSLPSSCGVLRQIDFPIEVREKLKSVIGLQVENLGPWSADEVYWDFGYSTPPKSAKSVRVTVAIIPKAALDPWIQFFKAINLPLAGATLGSLACAAAVHALWHGDAPVIVLGCEKGQVEGALVRGNLLHALQQTGEDVQANIRTTVERLVSLGRLSSIERARIIPCGADVNAVEGFEHVRLPLEKAKPDSSDKFGSIAAALSGLHGADFRSNLIPSELRYRHNQVQLIPTYLLLMLTTVLGAALIGREPYQAMLYGSKLEQEIRRIAPAAREVSRQQADLNKLSERYRALSSNLQNRDYNLEVLRELTRALPPKAWLGNYSYQDGTITVSGFAESASEVQKALADNSLFKDVQFTNSVTRGAKGKDHFTLKAAIQVPK